MHDHPSSARCHPVSRQLTPRLQCILRWFLPVTIIMLISTVLSLVGVDSESWFWTLFGIAAVIFCVQVIRFSL